MTDTATPAPVMPPGQAHNVHAYRKYKCRCDTCKAAYSNRYQAGPGHKTIRLHCDDCEYTSETAVDMHEHTLTAHRRYLTINERTPRR
jgi:hypothetical protein